MTGSDDQSPGTALLVDRDVELGRASVAPLSADSGAGRLHVGGIDHHGSGQPAGLDQSFEDPFPDAFR